jgi:hypothetical protein
MGIELVLRNLITKKYLLLSSKVLIAYGFHQEERLWCIMLYYRFALRESHSAAWRWKSSPLTSLHPVLALLNMYRCMPREHMRVFLSTSPEQMDRMLGRANQGLVSTAITPDQLWDNHRMSWIEVRRLEVELGAAGDHDQPYSWNNLPSGSQALAWTKLLASRVRGELEP